MFCTKCGKQIKDDVRFCTFCGAPTKNQGAASETPSTQESTVQAQPQQMTPPAQESTAQTQQVPPVQQMTPPAQEPEEPRKSHAGLVVGIVLGIVILLLAGGIVAAFASGFAQKTIATSKVNKYIKNEDYEKAIDCYEDLLDIDDSDENTYLALADLYLEIGDLEGARGVLERGMKRIRRPSEEMTDLYDDVVKKLERAAEKASDEDASESTPVETADGDTAATDAATENLSSYDSLQRGTANTKAVNVSLVSTDVSDYPLVRLYLDVTDEYGNQVEFAAPRGAIKEAVSGGAYVEREVKRLEMLEGNEGLSIELIADKSGSMDWRMDQVKNVMSEFVGSLDYASGDEVELIAFDSYVMYMCTRTSDVTLLNNGIYNMVPTGMTALYDALYEGVVNAGYQGGARCVIAFTDGYDNESIHTAQEIINLAQGRSVAIYIIGTDKNAESTLQNIAYSTSGYYWYIDDLADMGQIFEEIYEEQKDLYCLEYVSDGTLEQYAGRTVDFIIGDTASSASLTASFTPVETLEVQTHTSRYEIIPADVSWTEANTECILRGGHLATITSEDEMNQLIALAESSGLKYLWIGGYTSVGDYEAFGHWVTGEPFQYTAWYEGEPSRNDMDGTPEMYIMMWKLKDAWSWNDQRNDPAAELSYFIGNIGYICEYEE